MAKVTSELDICNLALLTVGHHTISSLDKNGDNDTLQAETCRAFYDQARMSLLSRYNWTFALSRWKYDDRDQYYDDSGVSEYKYVYPLPRDFLKLVFVRDNMHHDLIPITGMKPPYSLESGYLFTDTHPCRIVYVSNAEDISKFSPAFVDSLILELAIRFTKILNDSTTYKQHLTFDLERIINEAKRVDCQQIILGQVQSFPLLASTLGAI